MSTYEALATDAFGTSCRAPNTWPATSFSLETTWGQKIAAKMVEVETELATTLLQQLAADQIPGAVAEFGTYWGDWLERLISISEQIGYPREFYGFDSFEGLPALSEHDLDCWREGMYAAPFEQVQERLRIAERPYVHLVKGWFRDSIHDLRAQRVDRVAFARVDGDLYASAVDALGWIAPRLSMGSILVFDDWTFDPDKGETKAFFEWLPTCGHTFELIGHLAAGHLYLRTR